MTDHTHDPRVAFCTCGYTSTAQYETCLDTDCPAVRVGFEHAHLVSTRSDEERHHD